MLHSEMDLSGRSWSRFMDKFGSHDAVPHWTIPISKRPAAVVRTAASQVDPGAYRVERDFPSGRDEVPKGLLTTSASAPTFKFPTQNRLDKRGFMKGMNQPPFRWHNDLGPGQYSFVDDQPAIQRPPQYSMPRATRSTERVRGGPGPGHYSLPSKFGGEETKRGRVKKCQREAEFETIFRSIHASARHGPQVAAAARAAAAAREAAALEAMAATAPGGFAMERVPTMSPEARS